MLSLHNVITRACKVWPGQLARGPREGVEQVMQIVCYYMTLYCRHVSVAIFLAIRGGDVRRACGGPAKEGGDVCGAPL